MPVRRRGSLARRHVHRRAPPSLERHEPFEQLVADALDALPPWVRGLLGNVAIVIDDEPTPEQLQTSADDGDTSLYGLYEGTPAVEYAADWVPFPNKITLFRLPLEADFPDPTDLAGEVRRTVVHELAHHAGIGEERLRQLGFD